MLIFSLSPDLFRYFFTIYFYELKMFFQMFVFKGDTGQFF